MPRIAVTNILGSALDFKSSPSGSRVAITTVAAQNGLSALSVSLWFYIRSTPGTSFRLFSKGAATNAYFQLFADSSDRILVGSLWSGTYPNWSTPSYTKNAWHHVVVTYSFTNTSTIPVVYLDNVQKTVTTAIAPTGTAGSDDTSLYIGNRPDGARGTDGMLDDVRLYNRILTPTEIASLYNQSAPVDTGLVGYWPFDRQLDGFTAIDFSPSQTNGAIAGANYVLGNVNINPGNPISRLPAF